MATLLALPTAAAADQLAVLASPNGFVNQRTGPGTEHAALQRLCPGQKLTLLRDGAPWAEVQLTDGKNQMGRLAVFLCRQVAPPAENPP